MHQYVLTLNSTDKFIIIHYWHSVIYLFEFVFIFKILHYSLVINIKDSEIYLLRSQYADYQ